MEEIARSDPSILELLTDLAIKQVPLVGWLIEQEKNTEERELNRLIIGTFKSMNKRLQRVENKMNKTAEECVDWVGLPYACGSLTYSSSSVVKDAGDVSSVTDSGSGQITINFSSPDRPRLAQVFDREMASIESRVKLGAGWMSVMWDEIKNPCIIVNYLW